MTKVTCGQFLLPPVMSGIIMQHLFMQPQSLVSLFWSVQCKSEHVRVCMNKERFLPCGLSHAPQHKPEPPGSQQINCLEL